MSIEVKGRDKIVPIDMRVKVDGKYEISYIRSIGELAYDFMIFPNDQGSENAMIQVISAMESQSYDHGAQWRRTNIYEIPTNDNLYKEFRVGFRIRDSY